ncbi:hypothetical protein RGQ13_14395 [Thalassotalea psychrophila]|uniref:Glycosyl transferase family 1 domain-containing protein n=1 Tax=Thalassotalea psychrophila TaxID=3065647 RepID=A0ABY9TRE8_9GAMM|nr:hypothetical protein RGQ13_14395 [Colwelliaceae bacterium SQ149]
MRKIVISDPGLREYGGHHPGMISALTNSELIAGDAIKLDVYCNNECDINFIETNRSKKNAIIEHFSTDFYLYFYQSCSISDLTPYINKLVKEYLDVLLKYQFSTQINQTIFLYHTLHWEHAMALACAISLFKKQTKNTFQYCIFLMYSPEKYSQNGLLDIKRYLNFKVAFNLLQKQHGVRLFAADEELRLSYKKMLNINIDIHPCGLLNYVGKNSKPIKDDFQQLKSNSAHTKRKKYSILLFTGDAKVNKGFLDLPSLLSEIISNLTIENLTITIQYTITNESEQLKSVDETLKGIACNDKRIVIVDRFWTHTELHDNFSNADIMLFNYCDKVYMEQSSGVLWLAAMHNLKMLFLTDTWLNREAERLNCEFQVVKRYEIVDKLNGYLVDCASNADIILRNEIEPKNSYRTTLLQDLSVWLDNIYKEK